MMEIGRIPHLGGKRSWGLSCTHLHPLHGLEALRVTFTHDQRDCSPGTETSALMAPLSNVYCIIFPFRMPPFKPWVAIGSLH